MLPLINYLPDRITHYAVCRLSKRVTKKESWEDLLRRGIRGATEREILRHLSCLSAMPVMLEPANHGLSDRIDLYYKNTGPRLRVVKSIAKYILKAIRSIFGLTIVPDLSLAFQKRPQE